MSLKLPRWANARRLHPAFSQALAREGLLSGLKEACVYAPSGAVTLPGFNIFDDPRDPDGLEDLEPWRWCTPRFKGGYNELLGLYEEFVNQGEESDIDLPGARRTTKRSPTRVLRNYLEFFGQGAMLNYFGGVSRPAQRWMAPGLKLVALAFQVERDAEATITRDGRGVVRRVRIQLGPSYFDVSQQGCWSNYHQALVTPQRVGPAADYGSMELSVDAYTTTHALARALVQAAAPVSILRAANVLIRAHRDRRISSPYPDWGAKPRVVKESAGAAYKFKDADQLDREFEREMEATRAIA